MSGVNYEKRGAIALLTLNRPEKLNAIDVPMQDQLVAALDTAENDSAIRAIVLNGAGRAFSAGFDLDMGKRADGETARQFMTRALRKDFATIMRFRNCPKPVIAAVHGYCLGSSMEISALCDITIAAEGCRFGAPEVRYGSGIVCMILPWIIGEKNARELLLVGSDRIDAVRALAIGLINCVVPADQLMQHALSMANEIALNDPLAVQLTKKAINVCADTAGMREALLQALEIDIEIESTETAESKEFNRVMATEGAKAALEWRAAQLPADEAPS